MSSGDRVCPACEQQVEFKDMTPLSIKRPGKPDVTFYICTTCYVTAANVLKIVQPYYPQQLIFEYLKK